MSVPGRSLPLCDYVLSTQTGPLRPPKIGRLDLTERTFDSVDGEAARCMRASLTPDFYGGYREKLAGEQQIWTTAVRGMLSVREACTPVSLFQ